MRTNLGYLNGKEPAMTQTARKIARAFVERRTLRIKNTHTDGHYVWHHGHIIAHRNPNGSVEATLAGWGTVTTRDRVNAIANATDSDVRVYQHKHAQRLRDWRSGHEFGEISSSEWFELVPAGGVAP